MARPNVPSVTVSRRPTPATRSRTTTAAPSRTTPRTNTNTRCTTTGTTITTTRPSDTTSTTTTSTTTSTTTGNSLRDDQNQNQRLLDIIVPFFDEYQTYCVTGATDDDDDDPPNNHDPHDTITSCNDQRQQLRDRLVPRILQATTNPPPYDDDTTTHDTGTTTTSRCRTTPITECFEHLLQAAVAHVVMIPSASSSRRGGTTSRPSIRASSAILELWVSTVVAWVAQYPTRHHVDSVDLWFSRLHEYSQCQQDAVRIVSVRALCHWAECLGRRRPVATMDDATEQQRLDRLDAIQQAILPRFTDKAIAVRCAVVQACFTITTTSSNPLCTDPDLLQAIQWIVQHDPSPNNRQMALQHVPINRTTMEYVIPRLRDTKLPVRLAAIAALSRAVDRQRSDNDNDDTFALPSRHMAELITSGYTERCLITKEAIRRMVCTSWIPAANYNPITLLQWLNVMDHPTVATTILQIWSDVSNASPPWLLQVDQQRFRDGLWDSIAQFTISHLLDHHAATAIPQLCIARNLLQLIPSEYEKDILWSQLVPDIPMLCQVLETLSSKLVDLVASQLSSPNDRDAPAHEEDNMTFVCLELLQMASIHTSSMEEGSRRVMASTITNLLSNVVTPDDLLEGCVTTLRTLLRADGGGNDDNGVSGSIEMGMLPVIRHLADLALSSENELLRVHTSIRIVFLITLTLENRDGWTTASAPAAMEAMEFFWNQVRPWTLHENRWLRQAAVRTMGLLGLGSTGTVMVIPPEEFTAMLLEISGHEMEEMEIRIQALLALTDWVLLQFRNGHGRVTTNDRVFDLLCGQVDQLLDVPPAPLFSSGTIGCAAEIATKLILLFFLEKGTGPNKSDHDDDARIRTWLARLVWLYFDHENLEANDLDNCDNDDDVSQVGHPVRLQQLLSVFFSALTTTPAMRHSSAYFIESITPLLTMSLQLWHKKQKSTAVSLRWIRSIDFVISCVSKSRQQQERSPTTSSSKATLDETPAMDHDHDSESPTVDACTTKAQFVRNVTESSPGLIASVKVAAFLSEQGSMINAVIRRALCKWISNQSSGWEVENELWEDLTRFKDILEELVDNDGIDDASCRRMLEPVLQMLRENVESDVEYEDEGDEEEADDDDGVAAALSNDFEKVHIRTDENENSKSTDALPATAKQSGTEIGTGQEAARRRNERARRRLRPSN